MVGNKERFRIFRKKLRWPFIFSSKFFQAKDGVIENNHHLEKSVAFENVNKVKNSSNFQKLFKMLRKVYDLRGVPEIFEVR